ncbi:dTMP kinase [Alphaproteobacteria bacterium]|nr:dTMP kinase [Alphaproteobacteria bacterium]MDC0148578.1 dTMP kinase [Alphaproteobacteria bacterium]
MRGKFISFEGGEGGGKSTQAARLAGFLKSKGLDIIETREPGGTQQGEDLRDLLVQGDPDRWLPLSELLMMTAARVEHVHRLIEPALAAGKWVICDRFMDSTLAYQGIAGGLGVDMVSQLQAQAVGSAVPDVTFLLDVRAEAGLKRAANRGGAARFEKKGAAFHQTLRDGFLAIANENSERVVVVDAEDSFEAVWGQIEQEMARRFKL